jgi:hypothetical protein
MKHTQFPILLACCILCTLPAKSQQAIDPKRIAQINANVEIELPAEEKNCLSDRQRMDDDELEFRKDTFRVKRAKCYLMSELEEDNHMAYVVAVYDYAASRYAELIHKYDALIRTCRYKKYRKAYIRSQKSWVTYQAQTLALFGKPSDENYELATRRMQMNLNRLEEIYYLYSELVFEGSIRSN